MSIEDLKKALDLIESNFTPEERDFCGNQSLTTIKKAENILDVKFPKSYKIFLEKYGCGGVGSLDIYGLIKDEDFNPKNIPFIAVPNAVWTTLQWHRDFNHPLHLIIISGVGDGSVYCLDTSQMDMEEECPVVLCPVGYDEMAPNLEVIAEDFGQFFLAMVQKQIIYEHNGNHDTIK